MNLIRSFLRSSIRAASNWLYFKPFRQNSWKNEFLQGKLKIPKEKLIVVFSLGATRCHLLLNVLNEHDEIEQRKELFSKNLKHYPSFLAKKANQNSLKYWGTKVIIQRVKRQVSLGKPNEMDYLLDFVKKNKGKVIFIERENLLEGALNIKYLIIKRKKTKESSNNPKRAIPLDRLSDKLKILLGARASFLKSLEDYPFFHIQYHKNFHDEESQLQTWKDLGTFLGVENMASPASYEPNVAPNYKDYISNWEEIDAAIDNGYESDYLKDKPWVHRT